jgi:LysR family nitrogen assimilation transcriptional regulator
MLLYLVEVVFYGAFDPIPVASMDIRQLSYFARIVELGSLSRAAEHLHIAQPALTRHVRLLEAEVGLPLLHRHGRGVVPTAAGNLLLKHASHILTAFEAAKADLAALKGHPVSTIRLGVPPAVSECLTAEFLGSVRANFPQIDLQIMERWTGHIHELLLEKKLDIGILSVTQIGKKFDHLTLADEPLFLIQARTGATPRPSISIRDLQDVPLVLAPRPHGSRLVLDEALKRHDIKANVVLESEVWSVIKDVVQKGIASTIVPRREVLHELRSGVLQARPLTRPALRHKIVLARLRSGRRPTFEDDLFTFLSSQLRQALTSLEATFQ